MSENKSTEMSFDDALEDVATTWGKISKDPEEPLLVRFKGAKVEKRVQHWIGGSYEDCEGQGCPWCAKGNEARTSYATEVELTGDPNGMIGLTKRAMTALKTAKHQLGAAFTETWLEAWQTGTGLETAYHFEPTKTPF